MIKVHSLVKGTTATLLAALGLVTIVWAHGRSAPPSLRGGTDSVRAVKLRLSFDGGDRANVTEVEGGMIKIEKNGKKLAITPYIRDQGKVELQVFQAVQQGGREVMQAVSTLLVDKAATKIDRVDLPFSVQVLDVNQRVPAEFLATAASQCCVRTCSGTLICGVCVCTDCGQCATVHWCDCAPPAPPDE
jgi:hypothetical protein